MQAMQGQQDSGCWRWRSRVSKVEEGQVKSQRVLKREEKPARNSKLPWNKKPKTSKYIFFYLKEKKGVFGFHLRVKTTWTCAQRETHEFCRLYQSSARLNVLFFLESLCRVFPLKLPLHATLQEQSKHWHFYSDGASGYWPRSLLCTTVPRKLPRRQKRDILSSPPPLNKSHDTIIDSYGKTDASLWT